MHLPNKENSLLYAAELAFPSEIMYSCLCTLISEENFHG